MKLINLEKWYDRWFMDYNMIWFYADKAKCKFCDKEIKRGYFVIYNPGSTSPKDSIWCTRCYILKYKEKKRLRDEAGERVLCFEFWSNYMIARKTGSTIKGDLKWRYESLMRAITLKIVKRYSKTNTKKMFDIIKAKDKDSWALHRFQMKES